MGGGQRPSRGILGDGGPPQRVFRRLLSPGVRAADWTADHQAALRSALVNGQWTQQRLHAAGIADDAFCRLCRACGLTHDGCNSAVVAGAPPLGNLYHRLARCPVAAAEHDSCYPHRAREREAVAAMIREAMGGEVALRRMLCGGVLS